MARLRDLKDYINHTWYDQIKNQASYFIKQNYSDDEVCTSRIPEIKGRWLEDIQVTSVYTKAKENSKIDIFMTVRAQLCFKGIEYGKRGNDISDDSRYIHLSMIASVKFDVTFKNFWIHDVRRYDDKERFTVKGSSTAGFVPYMDEENLDHYAEQFLTEFYPKALETPMPLPIFEVAQRMGVTVVEHDMPEGLFGKTYFLDNNVDGFKKGTILYDPTEGFIKGIGSVNNTIVHEFVHWCFHKRFFDLMRLFDETITSITCATLEADLARLNSSEDFRWMEWQANVLAPRILMPAKTTLAFYNDIYPHNLENCQGDEIRALERTIESIASFFEVSKVSAKIRLIQLGIKSAFGIGNYIDGEKISSYKHNNDQIGTNQTFHVDFKDAVRLSLANERLKSALRNKHILNIDGFFVINNQKFIEKSTFEAPKLTKYAREHMDECCLVFDVKKTYKRTFDDKYYSLCFMSRFNEDDLHLRELNHNDPSNIKVFSESMRLADVIEDGREIDIFITDHMVDNFACFFEALLELKEMGGISNSAIAKATLLDNKTISNYRSGATKPASLKHVLAICAGLCLEPKLTYTLLDLSGFSLGGRHEDVDHAYNHLINYHYEKGIEYWNKELSTLKIPDANIP
jgi:hypothetical protein